MNVAERGSPAADTSLRRSGRVGEVDALRCFAMTAVIAEHCGLLPCGWLGVWLFFAISGYVVTASVLFRHADTDTSPGLKLRHFYARRAARIIPIYYLYSLAGFLVSGAVAGHYSWAILRSLLLFFHNHQMAYSNGELPAWPVGHLWTISVEMQFYLVYGLALPFLSRRHLTLLLATFLVVSPLLRLAATAILPSYLRSDGRMAYAIYAGSIFQFDSFAAGALVALHRPVFSSTRAAARLFVGGLCALALYSLAYVLVNIAVRHDVGTEALRDVISGILFGQYRQVFLYSAVACASAGLVAMAVSGHPLVEPVLRRRILQRIGVSSYGAYVYHGLALVVCGWAAAALLGPTSSWSGRSARDLFVFATAYPMTLVAADVSYRYLELPIIRAMNGRLARHSAFRAPALNIDGTERAVPIRGTHEKL